MSSKTYQVTGPLATPYLEDGSRVYLYEGALLPDGLREGEVERLVDLGLAGEVEITDESADDGPPAKSASKGDWEAYARSQGATDDDLDGVTKDELIASYGD
jgi:hypothetical protein